MTDHRPHHAQAPTLHGRVTFIPASRRAVVQPASDRGQWQLSFAEGPQFGSPTYQVACFNGQRLILPFNEVSPSSSVMSFNVTLQYLRRSSGPSFVAGVSPGVQSPSLSGRSPMLGGAPTTFSHQIFVGGNDLLVFGRWHLLNPQIAAVLNHDITGNVQVGAAAQNLIGFDLVPDSVQALFGVTGGLYYDFASRSMIANGAIIVQLQARIF